MPDILDPHFLLRAAAFAVIGWLSIVWVSGLGYIAVTFPESARHVPRRPLSATMRAVLREAWCVFWTQPLMLWFQFFGKDMGSGGGDVPIVLVHGYFQNRVDFLYLVRRLRKGGCGPLYAINFAWPQPLEYSSSTIAKFVDQVRAKTGAEKVDLLTHSTGGLFALDLIAQNPEIIRRAAVIALPGKGVTWRGPVIGKAGSQLRAGSLYHASRSIEVRGVPVLSAYSAHDNLVHPVETSRLEGESVTNFEVDSPGHLSVLFDRQIGDAVCEFLLG